MKIVQIHNRSLDRPTGVITHIRNLAETLAKRGHEVEVMSKGRPRSFVRNGVKYHQYSHMPLILKDFDIVHAHDVRNAFVWAHNTDGVAKVVTNHTPLASTEFLLSYHSWHNISAVTRMKVQFQSRLFSMVGYYALRRCNRVIAVSNYVKKQLEDIYKVPSYKIEIVYNGINTDDFREFDRGRKKWDFDGGLILMLKPYDPRKGLHYLIRALETVKKNLPGFTLVALGPRPTGNYGKYISNLINGSNIKNNVVFTGKLSFDDLKYLDHQSDMVVIPSLQEGFSITALEAAVCSKPVVGFNVGGLSEAVIDKTTGFLVPLGDVASLAAAIEILLEDENLRCHLGANGQKRAAYFDWKKIAINVEKVYSNALS